MKLRYGIQLAILLCISDAVFFGTKPRRLGVAIVVAIHPDSQALLSKCLACIESSPVQMFCWQNRMTRPYFLELSFRFITPRSGVATSVATGKTFVVARILWGNFIHLERT
jgi:hypothetical protein